MDRIFAKTAAVTLAAVLFLPVKAQALSARRATVMDATTGQTLFSRRGEEQALIASTTKIMTALVVCEQCNVLSRYRIPKEAVGIEGSSMYLKEGEVLTVQELLYGLMLSSGNDAAVALACFCGGNPADFVELMNDKARTLGLKHTHFANPNGLDAPDHHSSAQDLAVLAAYAMENPIFAKTVSTKTIQAGGRMLRNHNKLLWQYEGCTGMKTGYTRQAGRTLVSSAERNGQTLVCVTLNDRDDWNDHKALLDYGFSAFPRQVLAEEGEELGRVPLQGSLLHMASVEARETVAYPLKQGEEVTMEVDLPDQAEAPGEIAGSVRFLVGSRQVGQTYLVWSGSARRDVVKERPVDSPLDFLPQSTPPTYEEMLSLFSKAGTVSE